MKFIIQKYRGNGGPWQDVTHRKSFSAAELYARKLSAERGDRRGHLVRVIVRTDIVVSRFGGL